MTVKIHDLNVLCQPYSALNNLSTIGGNVLKIYTSQVVKAAQEAGIIRGGEWDSQASFERAWRSICGVWASKWNERAWLSRRARGMSDSSLKMAVLLQQVRLLHLSRLKRRCRLTAS